MADDLQTPDDQLSGSDCERPPLPDDASLATDRSADGAVAGTDDERTEAAR